ncbi:serine/threonine protein kinase [Flavimobilis marinus]|uniref:non-specific serine/threonine protein kinase n=1 Tax=Flavimobilis marinus TaxID=285351 RepID=A0A1I2FPR6_9MICO|nr:serine/threonine protein kinase [Flavimobilis marinus]SFF07305.1 serine/threonine protein kinase [Flavimobilis marinus]
MPWRSSEAHKTGRRLASVGATITDPLVGHLIDGRYEVLSRLARGGMATVYVAMDRRLDREVALKVMHPHLADGAEGADFVSRFRREARAAARLTHPGLVAVYDQGVDDGTSYLTMEYVQGTNLRLRLQEAGALSVRDSLEILEAVLDALAAAHRNNLVHRDIKPENVLIALDGRVKVADFGLARAVTEVTSTATGTIFGTVAYLAPELILTGDCDARADVYAAGVLLFEMLTGRQPYTGDTPIRVAYRHVHEDLPVPSSLEGWIPQEVDELVCALAARDPENRPLDASAALDHLRRTRTALDEADLDQRAVVLRPVPPPPADEPDDDDRDADDTDDTRDETAAPAGGARTVDEVPVDTGATQALSTSSAGGTIALQIGADDLVATVPPEPPRPGRRRRTSMIIVILVAIAALVAGGTYWWSSYGPGAYTTVPSGLVGSDTAAATSALTTFGLRPSVVERFDDAIPAGKVIETSPGEGEQIAKEGVVEVVASKGIEMFTVPEELVGLDQEAATTTLTDAGFTVGDPTLIYDDTVPAGQVMAVSEDEGASVPHSTVITLTVSQGPQPVRIPQVVNSTEDAATAALESIGLKVQVKRAFSDDVAKGHVVRQSPEASAEGFRTDTVTIVVSKGRELVKVPDVQGMDTEAAHAALEDAELVPEDQFAWGGFLGKVRFQDVDPGTEVPKGTTIVLTIF